MEILLLTSPAPAAGVSPFSTRESLMPLGIGYLAAVLQAAGHRVDFKDLYVAQDSRIPDFGKYDFVCISSNTVCFRGTMQLIHEARLARKRGWVGRLVIGGPHTSVAPETIPADVDYLVQGEGEAAIVEIVTNQPSDRIVRKPRLMDLDSLPLPAYDLFIDWPYEKSTDMIPGANNVFSYSTSRGCPFSCSFCSAKNIWGRRYTYKSPQKVVDDICYLKKKYGCDAIYFREDNLTVNRDRVLAICETMMQVGLDILWATESRVDTLDEEVLKLMYQAGCRGLYFGIEAGNQKRLDKLNKGITVEQVENVMSITREIGYYRYASFIIDTPEETLQDRLDVFSLIERIKPEKVGLNHFTALPGSELYDEVISTREYTQVDDVGLLIMPHKNYPLRLNREVKRSLWQRVVELGSDPHPFKRIVHAITYRMKKYLNKNN